MAKPWKTTTQYRKELKAVGFQGRVVGEYVNANTKITHLCACGNPFDRSPTHLLHAKCFGCQECRMAKVKTSRNATEGNRYDEKLARFASRYVRVGKYVDGYTPLHHKCLEHDLLFSVAPNIFLQSAKKKLVTECPECKNVRWAGSKLLITEDRLRARQTEKHRFIRAIRGEYGVITGVVAKCRDHGKYRTTITAFNKYKSCSDHHGCWQCGKDSAGRYKPKPVVVGTKTFMLQGYEPYALQFLLTKYPVGQIEGGLYNQRSHITYNYDGRRREYHPDFIIPHTNIYVEVKSTYTLVANPAVLRRNKLKARAAERHGRFRLLVFSDKGERLPVPKDWRQMSFAALRKFYGLPTGVKACLSFG